MPINDPGISPTCIRPADAQPDDLQCDDRRFKHYTGVEEQDATDKELDSHLKKGRLAAFDSYAELSAYVGSNPIINKLGLIAKTRKGITNARMILDTKQSGVTAVTSQAQRVTLPRLFDATLQNLFLLTFVASGIKGAWEIVEAFVLDFSDAYWQIPILQSRTTILLCCRSNRWKTKAVCLSASRSRQLCGRHPVESPMCPTHAAHPIAIRPLGAPSSLLRRRPPGGGPRHICRTKL